MERHLDRLKELTESSRMAGSLADGVGRYARTPDYTAPAAPSSRPRSDRGTTFHFAHKSISKQNDISENNFTQTTSAAHQGYIERPSATEEISPEIANAILKAPISPIQDGLISEGFIYPQRVVDPRRASFGTLGTTKAERKTFWNDIEASEGSRGRIQSRIIAELPVEFDLLERCSAARDFCQSFEERGLPYWATIHAPGKRNDKRNYHLHITYFDRPTGRNASGEWAHTITEKRRKKSRHTYFTRPHLSNKHPDTRAIDWPRRLRRNYADTCNFYLSAGNHERRYDPRSYRDAGIAKEPTEHLGNKLSALESMGLETNSGQRNAKREIRWKISLAEEPWVQRARSLRNSPAYDEEFLSGRRKDLEQVAEQGITHARKSASLQIVSDLITHRMKQREAFLEAEIHRLGRKDDLSDLARRSSTMIALSAERDLIMERAPALQNTAKKCKKLGAEEMKKSTVLMRRFDSQLALFDPEALLDSASLPELEDIETLAPEGDGTDSLDSSDLGNIEDLFGDIPPQKPREPKGADKADISFPQEDERTEAEDAPLLRIQEIIHGLSREGGDSFDGGTEKIDVDAFPDAWAIQPTREKGELVELDRNLASLDNRKLRQAAIATRDATDLCPSGPLREDFNRGWTVLRYEAERRGLDLDTGLHAPETATDPERSLLHADQEPCPIRVVRKNIARQRVRA